MGLISRIVILFAVFVISEREVLAQRIGILGFGRCPKKTDMEDFDINKFNGTWHEIEKSFYLMQVSSSCTSYTFTPVNTGNDVNVIVKSVNRWTSNPNVVLGKATRQSTSPSVLQYTVSTILPSVVARGLPSSGSYHIIDTDYTNYAILWTCSNMRLVHTDNLWVLGRTRHLPVEIRTKVYSKLHDIGFDSDRLTVSKNENCPAF